MYRERNAQIIGGLRDHHSRLFSRLHRIAPALEVSQETGGGDDGQRETGLGEDETLELLMKTAPLMRRCVARPGIPHSPAGPDGDSYDGGEVQDQRQEVIDAAGVGQGTNESRSDVELHQVADPNARNQSVAICFCNPGHGMQQHLPIHNPNGPPLIIHHDEALALLRQHLAHGLGDGHMGRASQN